VDFLDDMEVSAKLSAKVLLKVNYSFKPPEDVHMLHICMNISVQCVISFFFFRIN